MYKKSWFDNQKYCTEEGGNWETPPSNMGVAISFEKFKHFDKYAGGECATYNFQYFK